MEFPFMMQMLGTPCQVSNTKQGKMSFLLVKQKKNNCFLSAYWVDCVRELLLFTPFLLRMNPS